MYSWNHTGSPLASMTSSNGAEDHRAFCSSSHTAVAARFQSLYKVVTATGVFGPRQYMAFVVPPVDWADEVSYAGVAVKWRATV